MATESRIAANRENAQASTGPRTEEGKRNSSGNALTYGLFTMRAYVRPEEKEEYARLCAAMQADLNPGGALEQTFAMAIVGAAWRLRRCGLVEAGLAESFDLDPMEDEVGLRIQTSVDRARGQAFSILRHSTAELRRLQTERTLRREIFDASENSPAPDLASYREVIRSLKHSAEAPSAKSALNCRELPSASIVGRNTPCPCGSGAKYKRCCGKDAAPVLNRAA